MRSYAPAVETLQWQTLTPQHMPPIGEDFLLWRAVNESDGGICTIGRRWRREGDDPPIVYMIGTAEAYKKVLEPEEYKSCRWAAITPPKCVIRKRIKERQRMMELLERQIMDTEERMVKNG